MDKTHRRPKTDGASRPKICPKRWKRSSARTCGPKSAITCPQQKAITDEPEIKPPAKWKAVVKKILIVLGLLLALAFLYLFLLMGEPDDDDEVLTGAIRRAGGDHPACR